MKAFKTLLEEVSSPKYKPTYHAKKATVNTPHFNGHAHFKFERELGKYGAHEYRVTYRGEITAKDGTKHPSETSHRMVVQSDTDGNPFSHKLDGSTSKSLKKVLEKHAPRFISIDDLK